MWGIDFFIKFARLCTIWQSNVENETEVIQQKIYAHTGRV